MYPVYELDLYFSDWGMHNVLIGAKSKQDLRRHLSPDDLGLTKREYNELWKKSWRVRKVDELFTDKPYVRLCTYYYSE